MSRSPHGSELGHGPSGTLRPDRSVNSTVGSATSGALTNETNRDSLSGSSSTPFHSQAYPSTWRATASSNSAARPERVVADHVAQMVEAAVEALHPRRGALQPIRGADVEHQEAVDVADQRLVVEVAGQQLGVLGVSCRRCRRRRGSSRSRWR